MPAIQSGDLKLENPQVFCNEKFKNGWITSLEPFHTLLIATLRSSAIIALHRNLLPLPFPNGEANSPHDRSSPHRQGSPHVSIRVLVHGEPVLNSTAFYPMGLLVTILGYLERSSRTLRSCIS